MKTLNQNEFNDFLNDCTIVTMFQLIMMQWGLFPGYTFLDKLVILALKAKVLFKGGAVFKVIWNWVVEYINERLDITIKVKEVDLYSEDFKKLYDKDIYFGVWLRRGNKQYLESIKKGSLTKEDIDLVVGYQGKTFNHNNAIGAGFLYEVYTGQKVELPYDVLMHGINKGVFGSLARTFIPVGTYSRFVSRWLRILKDNPNAKYTGKSALEKYGYEQAVRLREKYKAK